MKYEFIKFKLAVLIKALIRNKLTLALTLGAIAHSRIAAADVTSGCGSYVTIYDQPWGYTAVCWNIRWWIDFDKGGDCEAVINVVKSRGSGGNLSIIGKRNKPDWVNAGWNHRSVNASDCNSTSYEQYLSEQSSLQTSSYTTATTVTTSTSSSSSQSLSAPSSSSASSNSTMDDDEDFLFDFDEDSDSEDINELSPNRIIYVP